MRFMDRLWSTWNYNVNCLDEKIAAIIDLDGTLADCRHRLHFINGEEKRWDAFYEAMTKDNINMWCKDIVIGLKKIGYEIFYITGRPEKYRQYTLDWLKENGLKTKEKFLLMRNNGDYRKDYEIKKELFDYTTAIAFVDMGYHVSFAIDDKKEVVEMWKSKGINCLYCGDLKND